MITKTELIQLLIDEYASLVTHMSKYTNRQDYQEDSEWHRKEARIDVYSRCLLGPDKKEK